MGLTEIKKELKKPDKNKLIELFAEIYKKNNSVLEAYEYFFGDFYKVQPANRTENNLQETGGKIIKLGRP